MALLTPLYSLLWSCVLPCHVCRITSQPILIVSCTAHSAAGLREAVTVLGPAGAYKDWPWGSAWGARPYPRSSLELFSATRASTSMRG